MGIMAPGRIANRFAEGLQVIPVDGEQILTKEKAK